MSFEIVKVEKVKGQNVVTFNLAKKYSLLMSDNHGLIEYDNKTESGKIFLPGFFSEKNAEYRARILIISVAFMSTSTNKHSSSNPHSRIFVENAIFAEYENDEDIIVILERSQSRLNELVEYFGSYEDFLKLKNN